MIIITEKKPEGNRCLNPPKGASFLFSFPSLIIKQHFFFFWFSFFSVHSSYKQFIVLFSPALRMHSARYTSRIPGEWFILTFAPGSIASPFFISVIFSLPFSLYQIPHTARTSFLLLQKVKALLASGIYRNPIILTIPIAIFLIVAITRGPLSVRIRQRSSS